VRWPYSTTADAGSGRDRQQWQRAADSSAGPGSGAVAAAASGLVAVKHGQRDGLVETVTSASASSSWPGQMRTSDIDSRQPPQSLLRNPGTGFIGTYRQRSGSIGL